MSIVPLSKITLLGHRDDKVAVLEALQSLGCLHIIPLARRLDSRGGGGPSSEAKEALMYLLGTPKKRRQVSDPERFDALRVEHRILEIKSRCHALAHEQDFLEARIRDLSPFGNFTLPPPEALAGYRCWFYMVPLHKVSQIPRKGLIFEIAAVDNRFAYVVVVSKTEPVGMPVPRTRTGQVPLHALSDRLEAVELMLEDLQAERASLTRWCRLFAARLFCLEDEETLRNATFETLDVAPLFALQGWVPSARVSVLEAWAGQRGLVIDVSPPGPEDTPPTLLENRPAVSSGQDLVSFYMTPGYRLWDPSVVVFFSFAVFFAMILSDAGYALVMAVGLLIGWRWMGRSPGGRRFRMLFAALVVASVVWGVLTGSYFGATPPAGSLLDACHLLDLNDFDRMMTLSILIGATHLVVANIADAARRGRSLDTLVPVGWIGVIGGAVLVWTASNTAPSGVTEQIFLAIGGEVATGAARMDLSGKGMMGVGALAVLVFTPATGSVYKRLAAGLLALTKITSAFGDALSYLRLFALGLASASLAMAFNGLADDVRRLAPPGFGLVLAMAVLVIGHGLNFVLALVGGVIHGLRLNFIEFFNWSIPEEGRPFVAFARKERETWSR